MKVTAVITLNTHKDVDGTLFEKTIRLVDINASEEFFNDFNKWLSGKLVKVHFEKQEV